MTGSTYSDGRPSRRVIRWVDDEQEMALADELRSRPYRWAVVGERVSDVMAARKLKAELGAEFEVQVVDGELQARFNAEFIVS